MLAKAADSYFCPVLELIADKLQMSDEVAVRLKAYLCSDLL